MSEEVPSVGGVIPPRSALSQLPHAVRAQLEAVSTRDLPELFAANWIAIQNLTMQGQTMSRLVAALLAHYSRGIDGPDGRIESRQVTIDLAALKALLPTDYEIMPPRVDDKSLTIRMEARKPAVQPATILGADGKAAQ